MATKVRIPPQNKLLTVLGGFMLVCCFLSLLVQMVFIETLSSARDHYSSLDSSVSYSHMKKTTTVYVVSLQGVGGADVENEGRMDSFRQLWNQTCQNNDGILQFKQCPGELDERRGFGLTRAYVSCFQQALDDDDNSPESVVTFLEDDARFFLPDFCNATHRQELWSAVPDDAFLIMLGGHTWQFRDENVFLLNPRKRYSFFRFLETNFSFGSYAFAVPRVNLKTLRDGYLWDLEHPQIDEQGHPKLSPDKSFYTHAKRNRQAIYAMDPLVFYHASGYSNTWKGYRDEEVGNTLKLASPEDDKYEYKYESEEESPASEAEKDQVESPGEPTSGETVDTSE